MKKKHPNKMIHNGNTIKSSQNANDYFQTGFNHYDFIALINNFLTRQFHALKIFYMVSVYTYLHNKAYNEISVQNVQKHNC